MNDFMITQEHYQIILFDGVCNFCNKWVNIIIRFDTNKKFKFASLQSDIGNDLLNKFGHLSNEFETIYLFDGSQLFKKSDAIINIFVQLSGLWKFILILNVIPSRIRDFFYDIISKNRYTFFGKTDVCQIPIIPEIKERFL